MIAQAKLLLPFFIYIPLRSRMRAIQYHAGRYEVIIHRPVAAVGACSTWSLLSDVLLEDLFNGMLPASPQRPDASVTVDGRAVVRCNLLVIDFVRENFDRSKELTADSMTPSVNDIVEVANSHLGRLRTVTQAPAIRLLTRHTCPIRLDYLSDDRRPLDEEAGLVRYHFSVPSRVTVPFVDTAVLNRSITLSPTYRPPVWETLLLDACCVTTEPVAAVALIGASLESLIEWCLTELQRGSTVPDDIRKWVNDRGDYRKDPSVSERFDVLLKWLTGRSLREDKELWKAFERIRAVRNNVVHRGEVLVNSKSRKKKVGKVELLDVEDVARLVDDARRIVAWIEALLPRTLRRPSKGRPISVVISRTLTREPVRRQLKGIVEVNQSTDCRK